MSACYSVSANLKIKNEKAFIKDSKIALSVFKDEWDGEFLKKIQKLQSVKDVMRFMLAADQGDAIYVKSSNGVYYSSGFDASYGWESVLDKWFRGVAKDLENKSFLLVYPDEDVWVNVVSNGKARRTQCIEKYEDYTGHLDGREFTL